MGYTTEFTGEFRTDKPMSVTLVALLEKMGNDDLSEEDRNDLDWPDAPDGYFQWEPTKDRKGIKWNGGEKFYDYVEWLQWIIDILKMKAHGGIKLTGQVEYQGERSGDWGILKIIDGKAVKEENPTVQWEQIAPTIRANLLDKIEEAARDMDLDTSERKAFASMMKVLKPSTPKGTT